jgi:hypothetical protein
MALGVVVESPALEPGCSPVAGLSLRCGGHVMCLGFLLCPAEPASKGVRPSELTCARS